MRGRFITFCHVLYVRHTTKINFAVYWTETLTTKIKHTAKIIFAVSQTKRHTVKNIHTAKVLFLP
jgi:hypothetical protein